MPIIVEVILASGAMILGVFAVFLLVFLIALMLLPVEKSLSKAVWEMTAPPRKRPAQQQDTSPGFKGFSQKHR
ncbi:MAG: hypothetical protein AB7J94_10110 [Geobacter sp.]|jgi:hypothetical protein